MKAVEWLDRGLSHDDPMDCFTNCWIGFNNLYSNYPADSERSSIKNFVDANVTESVAEELINLHNEEISYFISQAVINMSNTEQNTQRDINSYNISESFIAKLKSILMMTYQVRCNVIHGSKSPNRERDVELCRYSWPFIAELVDRYA
ncbi:hypothetical protein L4D00_24250 [Photobacterium swingsii]|uniref:hypothetical protein n=1 Tax=Photobacterium swingsii TaxID=680026 RepID=UPI003D101F77